MENKIIFAGPVGSGKTTSINSVSDILVVRTEAKATDEVAQRKDNTTVPEPMLQRFMEMEGFYRRDIVKATPFARVVGGIEKPFEGFDEITMDVGTLCDSCSREVQPGEKVIYHVRIGKIYCSDCNTQHHHDIPLENTGSLENAGTLDNKST